MGKGRHPRGRSVSWGNYSSREMQRGFSIFFLTFAPFFLSLSIIRVQLVSAASFPYLKAFNKFHRSPTQPSLNHASSDAMDASRLPPLGTYQIYGIPPTIYKSRDPRLACESIGNPLSRPHPSFRRIISHHIAS